MYIRTSDRINFKKCRRAWDLQSPERQNLMLKVPNENLHLGSAVHEALAAYYEPTTEQSTSLALEAFEKYCANFFNNANLMPAEVDNYTELHQLGRDMLNYYCNEFAPEYDNFEVVCVEREFRMPVYDSPDDARKYLQLPLVDNSFSSNNMQANHAFENTYYGGKLDGVVRDSDTGLYYVLEHKTAKTLPSEGFDIFLEMDEQIGSYILLAEAELGIEIEGVIYQALKKSTPVPPKVLKSGELSVDKRQMTTVDLFTEAVKDHGLQMSSKYLEFIEFLKDSDNKFCYRVVVRRNKHETENLKNRIKAEAADMLYAQIYPNPSRFHCNYCDVRPLCLAIMDGDDYEELQNRLFVQNTEYGRL